MKWFENIFTKSKLMIICGILSVAGYFALACISIINSAHLTEQYLILAVLSALLMICYKKGETSCQKALIGSDTFVRSVIALLAMSQMDTAAARMIPKAPIRRIIAFQSRPPAN